MAKSLVGLFDYRTNAQAALSDLQGSGFSGDNVSLIDNAYNNVASTLGSAGVPQNDAQIYEDGLQQGGALIILQALSDDEAYRATDILNRHNVVDIDHRWSGSMGNMDTTTQSTSGMIGSGRVYTGSDEDPSGPMHADRPPGGIIIDPPDKTSGGVS